MKVPVSKADTVSPSSPAKLSFSFHNPFSVMAYAHFYYSNDQIKEDEMGGGMGHAWGGR
jgi:hypothetical protein